MLQGPSHPPRDGKARQLVVFLHGWGADGNDLIGLAPALARTLPAARFASPHAPDPCDQNPMGRQWYSFADDRPEALKRGYERAAAAICAFIDGELERLRLDDGRLALVGFSQGAMMALHVGLRRSRPPAAVVGYSGMLIDEAGLTAELRSRPPLLLCHGEADPVVPCQALHDAVAALARHDVPAQWHVTPGGGHGIGPDALAAGAAFLKRAFRKTGAWPGFVPPHPSGAAGRAVSPLRQR